MNSSLFVRVVFATVLALGACVNQTHADLKREVVVAGKRATALLVLPSGRGFGSAFCIDPAGLFVTSEHVIRGIQPGSEQTVTLVLQSGEQEQRSVQAVVLKADEELDIAVLKAKQPGKLTALEFGSDAKLIETQSVVAFGYPFGTALAIEEKKYPSISVNVGRVTAIRKSSGKLERIQVDAQLNPGNSGGPLFDGTGRVIGVVASGVKRSGVSFVMPVSKFRGWLTRPTIAFQPPEIPFAERLAEREFEINVAAIGRKPADLRVRLTLGEDKPGSAPRGTLAKHISGDKFVAKIAPVAATAPSEPLQLEIRFDAGMLQGSAADKMVRVGKRKLPLSKLQSLTRSESQWDVVGTDGKRFAQSQPPKGTVEVALTADLVVPIELTAVRQLKVVPPPENFRIAYRLTVSGDAHVLTEQRGFLQVVRSSGGRLGGGVAGKLPTEKTVITEPVEIKFAKPYDTFTLGGGGRYLIFLVRSERKIIVVDAVAGKVAKVLETASEGDLIAAGRTSLFIVSPAKMMIQRWSLDSFTREKIAQLQMAKAPQRVMLGANSDGPLMLTNSTATLLDTQTLKPLKIEGNLIGGAGRYGYHLATSHDGQTFAGIVTGVSGQRYQVMHLRDGKAITNSFGSTSSYPRWVCPTADGSLVFATQEVYTGNGRKVPASGIPGAPIPTVDPRYFVGVHFEAEKTVFAVCTTADCRKVWQQQGGFPELVPQRISSWHDIYGALALEDKWRFQYLPWANVIATLPKGNEKVVLRRFDLLRQLTQESLPYLFVESIPPRQAAPGSRLDYQIQVQSRHGQLKFKLEDGPQGCDVSAAGRVTWDIPDGADSGFQRIIVSVRDGKGNETFHAFEVAIAESGKLITVK